MIQHGEEQDQERLNPGLDIFLKEENGILDMKIGQTNPVLDFSLKEENGILEIKMVQNYPMVTCKVENFNGRRNPSSHNSNINTNPKLILEISDVILKFSLRYLLMILTINSMDCIHC